MDDLADGPADDRVGAHSSHRVTVEGSGTTFDVAPGERLLAAARRAGVWLPFECGWGGCGTCKVTVVEGETALLFPAPSADPRDVRRRRVLACQSTPLGDLVVKTSPLFDDPALTRPVRDHVGELAAREELGPDLARFTFRMAEPTAYRPGQHAILDLGDGLRRCYSLAGQPGASEAVFIAKRYSGKAGSERLFALSVGDRVPMELPFGDMFLRKGFGPVVLVAGGTGVSAILALAEHLAAGGADGRAVHVFYGAGSPAELVCWDELAAATAALPEARLHGAVLTGPAEWSGARGFVTDVLAAELPGLADATFYVAGPPVMTDATVALLKKAGIQLTAIHHDSFG